MAVIFGLFSPWVTTPRDRAWEGQWDYKMGEGGRERKELKTTAVIWLFVGLNLPWVLGLESFDGEVQVGR